MKPARSTTGFPNLEAMAAILSGRVLGPGSENGLRELARKLGRSPGHVSLVLSGKRKSKSVLAAIQRIREGQP